MAWHSEAASQRNPSEVAEHHVRDLAHAMRWEFFDRNPITLVRQSTKRQREPEVLTVEELKALFEELEGIYRTMTFVGGVVGLRVSEVIGLSWSDCDFESRNPSQPWNRTSTRDGDENGSEPEAGTDGTRTC